MQALRLFAPFDVSELMNGNSVADDEPLRVFDAKLRQRRLRQLDHPSQRRGDERVAILDRLPRFAHRDRRSVLAANDATKFAIDLAHRVTITGANEPTASSCP